MDESNVTHTRKFSDPFLTAKGEQRAFVELAGLKMLWFNTGTLCNLVCVNCYIESSPRNDRLVYLTHAEVTEFLDEIMQENYPTKEIGITGGEPFMNPQIIPILDECLSRGFHVLVLTDAMRPMMKVANELLGLNHKYGTHMILRVSVDHYRKDLHEEERGPHSWKPMLAGLQWLVKNGFTVAVAGRTRWGGNEKELRAGFSQLFAEHKIKLDAFDPQHLILFPEMDEKAPVPEITTACWNILDVSPNDMMCASSRMVVKRKGADRPCVVSCTLLPYDERFEMGNTLKDASTAVYLNHPHCATFCVLGGGSCTAK